MAQSQLDEIKEKYQALTRQLIAKQNENDHIKQELNHDTKYEVQSLKKSIKALQSEMETVKCFCLILYDIFCNFDALYIAKR